MPQSKCAIALGSNLGDSLTIVNQALEVMQSRLQILAVSRWYRTKPIGYRSGVMMVVDQPDFINGCALIATEIEPVPLLQFLLQVELYFGRLRLEAGSARTLDLDLLFYEDRVIVTPELHLPHPRMTDRGFVLFPLAEIAPHWQHPTQNRSVAELAAQLDHPLCQPVPYGN
ncbi:MAG: 2-amino-4-hydroxy-6-hydroxymethyldihydropteridine diphosphokinase [Cyanobacteria bacterium M5B4]|nr:MAG: 2-amino-4-hydroxy-6-hydroxymethyldihydropteridine diphosphokinase [Cyanobacteria bacterium M5B4]